MQSKDVSRRIAEIGIVPSARVKNADHARFAAEVLCQAGIPVLEVTLTVPQALEVIADLAKRHPDLIVGAGTVLDGESARRCVDAGARFLSSPGFVPEVVECAKKADVAALPGALTPSEVIAAWKAGADFVKIFPASMAGGPNYMRAEGAAAAGGADRDGRRESADGVRLHPGRGARDWGGKRTIAEGSAAQQTGRDDPRAGTAFFDYGEGSAGAAGWGVAPHSRSYRWINWLLFFRLDEISESGDLIDGKGHLTH
jgi:Entner-Doudoroff aldolase